MHTKEVICWQCKAPNQVEDNAPELLDVVKDCVNFLADLNSASPFLSEDWALRSRALHKLAYTAHSKAKGG